MPANATVYSLNKISKRYLSSEGSQIKDKLENKLKSHKSLDKFQDKSMNRINYADKIIFGCEGDGGLLRIKGIHDLINSLIF